MTPTLADADALRLLSRIAGPRLRAAPPDTPPPADLLDALADTFGPAPAGPPPTEAALARAALDLAATDPATGAAIEAILEDGAPPTYGVVETVAVLTAALTILQTEVTFERTPAGKYKIKLHKRAASDALLKALAQLVMKALGKLPGDDGSAPPKLGA